MIKGSIVLGLALSACVATANELNYPVKPNPEVTVGDFCNEKDPDFVGYRYKEKIPYCIRNVSGWTKAEIYDLYGIPEDCRDEYTVDHFVPLALGGSNHDPNLWPEHKHVKATRQNLEMEVYTQLKNGEISQREAVQVITHAKMNPPAAHMVPSKCRLK